MTVGEFIKSLAREKGTSAAKIERDLGFSNGYIGGRRGRSFPYDRLVKIAEYLDVSPEYLETCGESISNTFSGPRLSDQESSLLISFRKLDAIDQGRALGYIDALLINEKYIKTGIPAGSETA